MSEKARSRAEAEDESLCGLRSICCTKLIGGNKFNREEEHKQKEQALLESIYLKMQMIVFVSNEMGEMGNPDTGPWRRRGVYFGTLCRIISRFEAGEIENRNEK